MSEGGVSLGPLATLGPFTLVGCSVRTDNAREAQPEQGLIGGNWQRFFGEVDAQLSDAVDRDVIYGAYLDYESDAMGPYTQVVGRRLLDPSHELPKGVSSFEIPGGRYQLFPAPGEPPMSVVAAWQRVWTSGVERLYRVDLELHGVDGCDLAIGIR